MAVAECVGAILPNYNHGATVTRAIDAVLGQSVRPAELIVIDDGSSDDSVKRIEQALDGIPWARLVRNESNRGVNFALAQGISLCSCPYVSPLSADNRLLDGFFERLLPWIAKHPEAGMYLTDFAFEDPDSGRLWPKHIGLSEHAAYLGPSDLVDRLAKARHILPAYGSVFRLDALLEAGGFPSELRWHADWFVELVLGFRHGCVYVPEVLATAHAGEHGYSLGARDWASQREVLRALVVSLQAEAYADVRASFEASGALAYFGTGIARVAWRAPGLARLPLWAIVVRETRSLLVRMGPSWLRRGYWRVRHWLQGARW